MESLFSHPAWKIFADDIRGWQDAISTQWRTMRPEDLRYAQGRFDGLDQVRKHVELCETLKAQAQEDSLDVAP